MRYEKWIEQYEAELQIEFTEVKKEEGTDFYEWTDFVVDKWTEHNEDYIDEMQEEGIQHYKENYE